MNTEHGPTPSEDLTALHAEALRRAKLLRREAINDFWRGADAALAATVAGAYRSAQRLAYRLAHHARTRTQADVVPCAHHDGV